MVVPPPFWKPWHPTIDGIQEGGGGKGWTGRGEGFKVDCQHPITSEMKEVWNPCSPSSSFLIGPHNTQYSGGNRRKSVYIEMCIYIYISHGIHDGYRWWQHGGTKVPPPGLCYLAQKKAVRDSGNPRSGAFFVLQESSFLYVWGAPPAGCRRHGACGTRVVPGTAWPSGGSASGRSPQLKSNTHQSWSSHPRLCPATGSACWRLLCSVYSKGGEDILGFYL